MTLLSPMTEAEFAAYLEVAIPDFAHDKVKCGQWEETQSLELSRNAYAESLPQGLSTPDNFLFTVRDGATSEQIGMLWFAAQAQKRGLSGIALHVFGQNTGAQALYQKLGYLPTNINMFKPLVTDTPASGA